jgi:hypothetical protein
MYCLCIGQILIEWNKFPTRHAWFLYCLHTQREQRSIFFTKRNMEERDLTGSSRLQSWPAAVRDVVAERHSRPWSPDVAWEQPWRRLARPSRPPGRPVDLCASPALDRSTRPERGVLQPAGGGGEAEQGHPRGVPAGGSARSRSKLSPPTPL